MGEATEKDADEKGSKRRQVYYMMADLDRKLLKDELKKEKDAEKSEAYCMLALLVFFIIFITSIMLIMLSGI